MQLQNIYREIEALGGATIMDDYDEGYTDGLDEALAILRKYGFGLDMAPVAEWRTIESAPRDWTDILMYCPDEDDGTGTQGVLLGWYSMADGGFDCWMSPDGPCAPTLWQPLPTPQSRRPHDHTTPDR